MYHVPFAHLYIEAMMKEVNMGVGKRVVRFQEKERVWRLPGLLYVDDMVLCGELEEDLRMMVGYFVEVCERRGLKVNAGKQGDGVEWRGGTGV